MSRPASRLRSIPAASPPAEPGPIAAPAPPPLINRVSQAGPAARPAAGAPSPVGARRPGLWWRLRATRLLLQDDLWTHWTIAGWLADEWPHLTPADAVARWFDETSPLHDLPPR